VERAILSSLGQRPFIRASTANATTVSSTTQQPQQQQTQTNQQQQQQQHHFYPAKTKISHAKEEEDYTSTSGANASIPSRIVVSASTTKQHLMKHHLDDIASLGSNEEEPDDESVHKSVAFF
jgi:uncharacterized protein YpuA (DUF1002 family)